MASVSSSVSRFMSEHFIWSLFYGLYLVFKIQINEGI